MCRISVGASPTTAPPGDAAPLLGLEHRARGRRISPGGALAQLPEDADHEAADDPEYEDCHDRRDVQRAERRDEPPEDPKVGLDDVIEEALDPVHPDRVRHPDP